MSGESSNKELRPRGRGCSLHSYGQIKISKQKRVAEVWNRIGSYSGFDRNRAVFSGRTC